MPSLSGATLGDGQSKHPRSRLEKSNGKGQGPGHWSTEVPAANRGHRSSRTETGEFAQLDEDDGDSEPE